MRTIPAFICALILLPVACTTVPTPTPSADHATATTRSIVRSYLAAVETGDAAAAAGHFAPNASYQDKTFDFAINGRPAIEKMLSVAIAMLKPVRRTILHELYEGEHAAIEWEATGTHVAPAMGVPATNRTITIRAVSLITVRDGAIMVVTDYTDRAKLEAQLKG